MYNGDSAYRSCNHITLDMCNDIKHKAVSYHILIKILGQILNKFYTEIELRFPIKV